MREGLDLFFRGERDYLQGSLIASQAARACLAATAPGEPRPWALTRATFRSVPTRHCLVTDETPAPGEAAKAEIRLRCGDGTARTLHVLEDPARREAPRRVADAPPLLEGFERTDRLSAKATLRPIDGLDALLSGLVQVNRRIYAEGFPGGRNPWILSFYDCVLPLDTAPFAHGARVTVVCESRRVVGPRTVTVQQVHLEGEGAPPVELRMLGSCEAGE